MHTSRRCEGAAIDGDGAALRPAAVINIAVARDAAPIDDDRIIARAGNLAIEQAEFVDRVVGGIDDDGGAGAAIGGRARGSAGGIADAQSQPRAQYGDVAAGIAQFGHGDPVALPKQSSRL